MHASGIAQGSTREIYEKNRKKRSECEREFSTLSRLRSPSSRWRFVPADRGESNP